MKDTFYFQHDYNARSDPKLQDVLIDFGLEGIGLFWCIIEQLYEQGGKLPLRSCKSIAFALHVDCNKVESLVRDYGLFKNDGEFMWSESVLKRLDKRKDISDKRKQAAIARWRQSIENQKQTHSQSHKSETEKEAQAMQMQCTSNANAVHKGKERKGNKREKEKTTTNVVEKEKHETARRFVPPTPDEVRSYALERGLTAFNVDRFVDFYTSNGWRVGKNPMKDWKAALRGWVARDDGISPAVAASYVAPTTGKFISKFENEEEKWK